MLVFKRFRRRVSVQHKHDGTLVITIARHNSRLTYIIMLIGFTAIFLLFMSFLARATFRAPGDSLYILPVLAFILLWYTVGVRISLWRAFGVEALVVDHNELLWTRTALFWIRRAQFPTKDISDVKAVTPWHARSNRVELLANGKRHKIGDMLLHDEAVRLAEQLRKSTGHASAEA